MCLKFFIFNIINRSTQIFYTFYINRFKVSYTFKKKKEKRKTNFFYSGISLCPYGSASIPSLRVYLLSSKQDVDVLLLS